MAKAKAKALADDHADLALIVATADGDPEQARSLVAEIRRHCPELLMPPLSTALDAYEAAALALQQALKETLG
jgi:hypothetical protein